MLSFFKKIRCIAWCLALNAALFLAWYASTPTLYNRYNRYNSPRYVYRWTSTTPPGGSGSRTPN